MYGGMPYLLFREAQLMIDTRFGESELTIKPVLLIMKFLEDDGTVEC